MEPPRTLSPRKLYASAATAGTEVGLDGVLVIRRLEDTSATTDDRFRSLLLRINEASTLPPPIERVLRLAPDASEVDPLPPVPSPLR